MFARLKETGRHTLVFGVGGVLQQGIKFLLLPVYTRYLAPSEYGVLNLILIAGSLVSIVPSETVGPALFRSYYDYQTTEERSLVVSTALFLTFVLAGTLLLIGILIAQPLSALITGDASYAPLLKLVLIESCLGSLNVVSGAVFRAQKWSGRYAIVSLSSLLVSMAGTIYLVVFCQLNITGVLIGGLIGSIVSAGLSLWLIRHHLRPAVSRVELRKMLRYGLPFIPEGLLGFAVSSLDRLVIQAFLGPTSVGLYALARRLGELVRILVIRPFSLIESAAVFSAERDAQAKEFYARLLTYYLLVTAFVSLGISLLAGDILRLMSDLAYWPASSLVPWVCLGSMLYGMRGLVSVGLALKRQTHWFPISFAVGALINLVLMLMLVPLIGLLGAAAASVMAYAAMCLIRYLAGRRIYPLRFERGRLGKLAVACATTFACGSLISVESLCLALALKAMTLVLGLPALLFALQFFDPVEIGYLKAAGSRLRGGDGKLAANGKLGAPL